MRDPDSLRIPPPWISDVFIVIASDRSHFSPPNWSEHWCDTDLLAVTRSTRLHPPDAFSSSTFRRLWRDMNEIWYEPWCLTHLLLPSMSTCIPCISGWCKILNFRIGLNSIQFRNWNWNWIGSALTGCWTWIGITGSGIKWMEIQLISTQSHGVLNLIYSIFRVRKVTLEM